MGSPWTLPRAALHQDTRNMATAATDDESGEIGLGELQLYHYQDGTPWLLGSGTFGKVQYIIFKFVDF